MRITFFVLSVLMLACTSARKDNPEVAVTNPESTTPPFEERHIYAQRLVTKKGGVYLYAGRNQSEIIGHLPYRTSVDLTRSYVETKTDSPHFHYIEYQKVIRGWVRGDEIAPHLPDSDSDSTVTLTPEKLMGGWLMTEYNNANHTWQHYYTVFDVDSTYKVYFIGAALPEYYGKWSLTEDGRLALNEGLNDPNYLPAPKPPHSSVANHFVADGLYNMLNYSKVDDWYWAGKTRFTTDPIKLKSRASDDAETITLLPKGASVNLFAEENGWAKVIHKSDTAYIRAESVTSNGNYEDGFVDLDLFPGAWSIEGESLVLERDKTWYWDGPESEEMHGPWKYNHQTRELILQFDNGDDERIHYVYFLSPEKLIIDHFGTRTTALRKWSSNKDRL